MKPGLAYLRLASIALLLATASGCAPDQAPKPDEGRVKSFASKGYFADEQFTVETTSDSWTLNRVPVAMVASIPSKPGRYPLVIYQPGIGQTAKGGEIWRNTWSRNGYAVLSLQPLPVDEAVIARPKTKLRDLAPLVRERFGNEPLAARVAVLQALVNELRRRQAASDPMAQKLDLDRVAIAGYDIGAYTALVLAGEHPSNGPDFALTGINLRAVVLLSPYSTFSGSAFVSRYSDVRTPALSITSDIDADPYGFVSSPALHGAPYRYMPPKDKYLLTFLGLPRPVLTGDTLTDKDLEPPKDDDEDAPKAEHHSQRDRSVLTPADMMMRPTERAIDAAAIQSISAAFLDSMVKGDSIAREWLDKNAEKWVGQMGNLQRR